MPEGKATLRLAAPDEVKETVRLLTITGTDLLNRMVFQREPEGYLPGPDGKDKYAYVGNGQATICVLVFEDDEAPDIITIGKKGEHGNFEERWERRGGQSAQLVITCPQAHLHSEPQLMPGPWCDVCSGLGQIEIVVGSRYEYRELCPVDECESEIDECAEHCERNDFGDHTVSKDDWHVDRNNYNDDWVVLRGTCDCGMECTYSIEINSMMSDVEWESK